MRLLRMKEGGDVSLEDNTEEKPSYAILSHRWGKDYEEVTFKEMMDHTYKDKRGYEKIRGCGEQAKRDGHQLFWVDTCCIDKSSSSELSESINSMWRWYCNSQVCYVYLDDVCADIDEAERMTAFTKSKWFTRGWTLQELLAPPRLEFYDAEWKIVGTKEELADKISEVTKINELFLVVSDISSIQHASIAQRMSWASERTTKKVEDIAYCLLGIFDINMPLLYGEGAKAFQRLQEEIVKHSDDQSILAWTSPSADIESGKLFAHSPAAFFACHNIVRSIQPGPVKPYSITNKGLKISLPLIRGDVNGKILGVLNCRHGHDTFGSLALPVVQKGRSHQYQRRDGELQSVLLTDWNRTGVQPMYISMQPLADYSIIHMEDNTSILRTLPMGLEVSETFPSGPWSHKTRTFGGNRDPNCPQNPGNRTLVVLSSGTTRCYPFMTFLHENKYFHDCVWDARLLPVVIDDSFNIEQIYYAWNREDLSTLQRSQHSSYGSVALRAVPRLIRGRKVTMIDISRHDPDAGIIPREAAEQVLVVLRSIGYRLSRIVYWFFGLLFQRASIFNFSLVLLLWSSPVFLLAFEKRDYVQKHSELFLYWQIAFFLLSAFCTWYEWRDAQRCLREGMGFLDWRDVRDYDVTIGFFAIVLLPCIPVGLFFGFGPVAPAFLCLGIFGPSIESVFGTS